MTTPDNRHQHLIVRAEISAPPKEADLEKVCLWMSALIKDIGMKELAAPRARYCPVEGNRGLTADAIIETSHCALHTWDECTPAVLQFDLYTCSELNVNDVLKHIETYQPTKIEYKFLDREHELILVDESHKISLIRKIKNWLSEVKNKTSELKKLLSDPDWLK